MHPLDDVRGLLELPVVGMSDLDACRLVANFGWFMRWLSRNGLTARSPEARAVLEQADRLSLEEIDALAPPPVVSPSRRDAAELQAFVRRAPALPRRLREVYELFCEQGLTLDQCATRLGIARETVRVHLRRLRALMRRDRLYVSEGPPPPRR